MNEVADQATFSRMDEGTADDWQAIQRHFMPFAGQLADRVLTHLQLLDGDYKVTEGVELILTPGHSPGGQSVVVDTDAGRYVIAGMCTLRANFYPPEEVLAHGSYKVIPTGMHTDPILCYDSMLRILEVGGENVLPFHDDAILSVDRIG